MTQMTPIDPTPKPGENSWFHNTRMVGGGICTAVRDCVTQGACSDACCMNVPTKSRYATTSGKLRLPIDENGHTASMCSMLWLGNHKQHRMQKGGGLIAHRCARCDEAKQVVCITKRTAPCRCITLDQKCGTLYYTGERCCNSGPKGSTDKIQECDRPEGHEGECVCKHCGGGDVLHQYRKETIGGSPRILECAIEGCKNETHVSEEYWNEVLIRPHFARPICEHHRCEHFCVLVDIKHTVKDEEEDKSTSSKQQIDPGEEPTIMWDGGHRTSTPKKWTWSQLQKDSGLSLPQAQSIWRTHGGAKEDMKKSSEASSGSGVTKEVSPNQQKQNDEQKDRNIENTSKEWVTKHAVVWHQHQAWVCTDVSADGSITIEQPDKERQKQVTINQIQKPTLGIDQKKDNTPQDLSMLVQAASADPHPVAATQWQGDLPEWIHEQARVVYEDVVWTVDQIQQSGHVVLKRPDGQTRTAHYVLIKKVVTKEKIQRVPTSTEQYDNGGQSTDEDKEVPPPPQYHTEKECKCQGCAKLKTKECCINRALAGKKKEKESFAQKSQLQQGQMCCLSRRR